MNHLATLIFKNDTCTSCSNEILTYLLQQPPSTTFKRALSAPSLVKGKFIFLLSTRNVTFRALLFFLQRTTRLVFLSTLDSEMMTLGKYIYIFFFSDALMADYT